MEAPSSAAPGVDASAATPKNSGVTIHAASCAVVVSATTAEDFLALLITSSLYYRRRAKRYAAFNVLALAAMLAGAAVGATSRMPGLYNTAVTFLLLWLGEKYSELHIEAKWNGWLLVTQPPVAPLSPAGPQPFGLTARRPLAPQVLVASVALYRAALAMHDHPEWVAAMFGADPPACA